MPRRSQSLHDIAVKRVHETPKAVLFDTGDDQMWVPKSIMGEDGIVQVEDNADGSSTLTAPEWWLVERGLV